jgi:molybdate transport system substrate-binding protein
MTIGRVFLLLLLLVANIGHAAAPLHIAVAASFRPSLDKIIAQFTAQTGVPCIVSSAATGVLYAQIVNGAGFDLLLAADNWRPARLVADGYAQAKDQRDYATGQLILVGRADQLAQASPAEILAMLNDPLRRIAIANPATAPYGVAAQQSLQSMHLWEATRERQLVGQNAAQAFMFFSTGNADLAFVSLSQWLNWADRDSSSYWAVPATMHEPLLHTAVIPKTTTNYANAARFLTFLSSETSLNILHTDGYGAP